MFLSSRMPPGAWGSRNDTHATWQQPWQGDDTVPEVSAYLPYAEMHPVHQHHPALYADNDVKVRLRLELTR